ncbi:unnamed protein product [Trichogramma brassicae]|uniref:Uncharacterized protein n=1 Tax=Trichogramma brassicae TaxID=86971 RepID=A0A6H5IAB9_9HYME|nr:unnamed protein product [Trichogramma brassicae]
MIGEYFNSRLENMRPLDVSTVVDLEARFEGNLPPNEGHDPEYDHDIERDFRRNERLVLRNNLLRYGDIQIVLPQLPRRPAAERVLRLRNDAPTNATASSVTASASGVVAALPVGDDDQQVRLVQREQNVTAQIASIVNQPQAIIATVTINTEHHRVGGSYKNVRISTIGSTRSAIVKLSGPFNTIVPLKILISKSCRK